jgi:general secretion pathway protein C
MQVQLSTITDNASLRHIIDRLPMVAAIFMLILLAYTASQLIWLFFTPTLETLTQAQPTSTSSLNLTEAKPDYAAEIAGRHLFGKADIQKTDKPIEAPETQLNLKLRGLYALGKEDEGYALIANGSNDEKLYRISDKLPGNIELKAVYPDRVILERSGKLETLRLIETKPGGSNSILTPVRATPPLASMGRKLLEKKFEPNSQVSIMREEIIKNPAKLAELVNAVPAMENGQFLGFRIITKKPHPVFKDLNLQSGDIITQVNGIDISSPQKGLQVLQQLSTAQQVQVTLLRNHETVHLDLSL